MTSICPIYPNDKPREKPGSGEALGFGSIFTDHMFVMDYSPERGWYDARIEAYAPLELDPAAMVLHYSQTIFEGMKAYRRKDGGVNLFRPRLNMERLNRSAERIAIPTIDPDYVLACLKELVALDRDWVPNKPGSSLYIRPFIFATEANLGVRAASRYKLMIILSPSAAFYENGLAPVSIYIENRDVRAVRGGIGEAKTGGNYAASVRSQLSAKAMSYDQVMWLDALERRYVEEVGAMNVFFVEEGRLITPKLNGSILPGITRRSVIELARSRGYEVLEEKVAIDVLLDKVRLGKVTEGFGSGTAAVIAPIGRVLYGEDLLLLGDGKSGPVALEIYAELTGIQYGDRPDLFGWVESVV